jgi:hypothetical protein
MGCDADKRSSTVCESFMSCPCVHMRITESSSSSLVDPSGSLRSQSDNGTSFVERVSGLSAMYIIPAMTAVLLEALATIHNNTSILFSTSPTCEFPYPDAVLPSESLRLPSF